MPILESSVEDIFQIDSGKKTIIFENGTEIKYHKCLIACGSEKIHEFDQYDNVYQLNTIKDHAKIFNALKKSRKVVIYGSNFETYELATSLREVANTFDHEIEIIIIEPPTSELLRSFGEDIYKTLKAIMLINDIKIISDLKILKTSSKPGSFNLDEMILLKESTNKKFSIHPDMVITELNLGKSNIDLNRLLV